MAIKKILGKEDAVLYKAAHSVTAFGVRLHELLDDMKETLKAADGVGLAAPQIGILRRIIVIMDEKWEPVELVNPRLLEESGEQYGTEGCLSVPGLYGYVKRPMQVRVEAYDRYGKAFFMEGTGLTARALCHEIDHLRGRLFLELADRLVTAEELDEMAEEQEEGGTGRRRKRRPE